MFPFGLLGILIFYVTNPFFLYFLSQIPNTILTIISVVLLLIFIIDMILSFQVLIHFRALISSSKAKDKTNDIRNIMKDKIKKHRRIHQRLLTAYPLISKKFNAFLKKIKL